MCMKEVIEAAFPQAAAAQQEGRAIEGVFDEEGEDEKDVEEMRDEGRGVIKMMDPKLPCQAEVEQHCLTHVPYRNWCRHCVRGRGKEAAQKKGSGGSR